MLQPVGASADVPGSFAAGLDVRSVRHGSGSVELLVGGELDLATAPALAEHLHRALVGCSELVVDLRGVTFCGAHGVRVLEQASAAARTGGVPLSITGAGPLTRRIMDICASMAAAPRPGEIGP